MAEIVREIEGLSQLLAALDQLPKRIERNVVRAALRRAITPIATQVSNEIARRVRTGALARSTRIKTRNEAGQPKVMIIVGDKQAFYAHMVERGTAPHEIRPKGAKSLFFAGRRHALLRHPGARPAFILKRAYEERAEEAVRIFKEYAMKRIGDEWAKLAKKGLL